MLLLLLLIIVGVGGLNKVYPNYSFCSSDGKVVDLEEYTVEEIQKECDGYSYAEFDKACGPVTCCNEKTTNISTEFVSLNVSPDIQDLCSDSISPDATFGAAKVCLRIQMRKDIE